MRIPIIVLTVIVATFVVASFEYFDSPSTQSDNEEISSPDIFFPARLQESVMVVEEKDTSFENIDSLLELKCGDFACYGDHYENLVMQGSVASAFADLRPRYDEDSYIRALCHQVTHIIGRAAAEKYPDVADAYKRGDHFCWSGYYHGVMEGILKDTQLEDIPNTIKSICDTIPGKETYSFDYYNCVHGLGHGVMYITLNEIFEALEMCDNHTGNWERNSCYGGVFMENVITDFENHFTKYLKPEDPMYPCNVVDGKYKHACYMMQTSYALKVIGYDFSKIFELCGQVEDTYQDTCYQSIGRDASGLTISDVESTKNHCLLGEGFRQQSNCAIGAVKDFISYFHSDVQAKQLCEAFPVEIQDICLETAQIYYVSFQF